MLDRLLFPAPPTRGVKKSEQLHPSSSSHFTSLPRRGKALYPTLNPRLRNPPPLPRRPDSDPRFFFRVSFLRYIHCSILDSATISDLSRNSFPHHSSPRYHRAHPFFFASRRPNQLGYRRSTQEATLFLLPRLHSPTLYLLPFCSPPLPHW